MPENEAPRPAPTTPHTPTTTERGSFTYAHCPCGWRGPARRSRDKARTDAAEHTSGS
ncbi:hypothetical protein GCM10010329_65660 [Streptomyces spiroverticillatus]|uniref:hypothetical protein n=1 Tax=Streptomyces finlayi TaxID=67296 RepID=UPI0016792FCE|nr:hypothetical protein [Streptomyces finlayi]GHA33486.1 hypothetical protein GCM10010329_65660 [Streptomyces spiroverticillatus]